MMWVILMAAVGLTLISLEIIIPGGVLGAIGAVCSLTACALSFSELGSAGGMLSTIIILTATTLIIWLEFKLLSKTKLGRRAFLTKSVDGFSASYGEEAKQLIDSEGVTKTTLAPSGYITIGGKRYEAFSQSGLIEANAPVKVVGADNFRLIVVAK